MEKVFGKVDVPIYANITYGAILIWGLKVFFFAMGMLTLYYALMGALAWVTANGKEEKLADARNQIMHSFVALIVSLGVLVAWGMAAGNMLNIIKLSPGGSWVVCIPTIKGNSCNFEPGP